MTKYNLSEKSKEGENERRGSSHIGGFASEIADTYEVKSSVPRGPLLDSLNCVLQAIRNRYRQIRGLCSRKCHAVLHPKIWALWTQHSLSWDAAG